MRGGKKLEETDTNIKLYIPSNVKTRLEFFNGFGVKELTIAVIVMIAILPISFAIFKLKGGYLTPVLLEFIGVAMAVVGTTKDNNNLCVVDQIKYMIKFADMQKVYKYEYYDKWRGVDV